MGMMDTPALMQASAAAKRSLLMGGPLQAIDELPQVGHVVHSPATDLDTAQVPGSAQVVHGFGAQAPQQPPSFPLVHKKWGCQRFSAHGVAPSRSAQRASAVLIQLFGGSPIA